MRSITATFAGLILALTLSACAGEVDNGGEVVPTDVGQSEATVGVTSENGSAVGRLTSTNGSLFLYEIVEMQGTHAPTDIYTYDVIIAGSTAPATEGCSVAVDALEVGKTFVVDCAG